MAILATEKVLTLDYWKPASQLVVGDYVFDRTGKIVRVTMVQEYRAQECYEVLFDDHLTVCGDKHLSFLSENLKYRKRLDSYKGKRRFRRPLKELNVDFLKDEDLKTKNNQSKYSVPTTNPLELPHKDYPVPPFIFGFWFFARRSTNTLAAAQGTGEWVHEKFKDYGYKITLKYTLATGEREFTVSPSISSQFAPNIPTELTNNYILGSVEQRIELLSGILCAKSRQYNPKTDKFRITSAHYGTIKKLQCVAESLGCRTKLIHDEFFNTYTLFFKTRIKLVQNQVSPPVKVHHGRRYVRAISPIQAQSCIHIETTGQDNTILVGEGFIPTC